jgi:hypothetical protein
MAVIQQMAKLLTDGKTCTQMAANAYKWQQLLTGGNKCLLIAAFAYTDLWQKP